jgi:hypothetical protein
MSEASWIVLCRKSTGLVGRQLYHDPPPADQQVRMVALRLGDWGEPVHETNRLHEIIEGIGLDELPRPDFPSRKGPEAVADLPLRQPVRLPRHLVLLTS